MRRREFLGLSTAAGAAWLAARRGEGEEGAARPRRFHPPLAISTWGFGRQANAAALESLLAGNGALDAVEAGIRVIEADPAIDSVGLGGLPNRDGIVELDAAIIEGGKLRAGSVAGLRGIKHPISVARKVMEKTPHVLLVGQGALEFARSQGFVEEELLTEGSRRAWEEWKRKQAEETRGHDTIGLVAIDAKGNVAAGCSTSGLSWKLAGRVGDSPLIGHGLYCDSEVGGAAATGVGEEVIRVAGSYQVVEFMRQGLRPQKAVEKTLERVLRHQEGKPKFVGFVAVNRQGEVGFASTVPEFDVAVADRAGAELYRARALA